jgi:hypothetical protein
VFDIILTNEGADSILTIYGRPSGSDIEGNVIIISVLNSAIISLGRFESKTGG